MILQSNKYSVRIIDVDRVGGTAPAITIDFSEIIVPEFVQNIEVLDPSVIAISQLNLETAVILGYIKRSFVLFVMIAFFA